MEPADIKQLIETRIDGADAQVTGAGDRFDITVISDSFEGKNAVKRQQAVYACINQPLNDGSLHAVNIQTYTRAQWQATE